MKHNTCLPWMVVICGLLLSLQGCRSQPVDTVTLSELLMPPGCESACWQGIEPEKTTVDELIQILDDNNIEYVQNAMFLDQQLTFTLDTDNPLWPDNITPEMDIIISDYLDPDDNKVLLIRYVKINLCLSTIIEAFGLPDEAITSPPSEIPTLVYYDEGMEFFSDNQWSKAKSIQLRSPENLKQSYEDSSTISLDHFEEMISHDRVDQFSD